MKILWCWRCHAELPMLDEAEFSIVQQLYSDCMRATKEFREKHHLPLSDISMEERFSPVCKAYFDMTGFRETNENAVLHHRISLYGAICPRCGKPFRTPQASFCAGCGYGPNSEPNDA
jgi:hypothetical protein